MIKTIKNTTMNKNAQTEHKQNKQNHIDKINKITQTQKYGKQRTRINQHEQKHKNKYTFLQNKTK